MLFSDVYRVRGVIYLLRRQFRVAYLIDNSVMFGDMFLFVVRPLVIVLRI